MARSIPPMRRRRRRSLLLLLPPLLLLLLLLQQQLLGHGKTSPVGDLQPCQRAAADLFEACQCAPFSEIVVKELCATRQFSFNRHRIVQPLLV